MELLDKYNFLPSRIVLELTEKEAVIDYNRFEDIIDNYRRQGFRVAVDDAGTGYNSLKTLVYLKPEFIDKSLIRNIHTNPSPEPTSPISCCDKLRICVESYVTVNKICIILFY
ncbi:EAL domain-containing protein [Bacillus sp. DJP31]|uniref:EAL domain-containing protein n=1 Tax=Bacillus sp. DJP31 TaxID=3409789 RepID=UPI003BB5DA10